MGEIKEVKVNSSVRKKEKKKSRDSCLFTFFLFALLLGFLSSVILPTNVPANAAKE